jgi:ComEC/Rec2-related protein
MNSRWLLNTSKLKPFLLMAFACIGGIMNAEWGGISELGFIILVGVIFCIWEGWQRKIHSASLFYLLMIMIVFTLVSLKHKKELAKTYFHPWNETVILASNNRQHVWVEVEWTTRCWLQYSQGQSQYKVKLLKLKLEPNQDWIVPETETWILLKNDQETWFFPNVKTSGIYQMEGRLGSLGRSKTPTLFNKKAYYYRKGMIGEIQSIRSIQKIKEKWNGYDFMIEKASQFRLKTMHDLSMGIEEEKEGIHLIHALAFGSTKEVSDEIINDFRKSGTLHVFAVSGLHVALIFLIIWQMIRCLGVKYQSMLGIMILIVFFYAMVTGWNVSATRASLMIVLFIVAPIFDRKISMIQCLSIAAVILLIYNTQYLFDIGFQLSFLVLFISPYFLNPMMKSMHQWIEVDPFVPFPLITEWQQRLVNIKKQIASLAVMSFAAFISTLPVMIWHIGVISPISIVSNIVIVPFAYVALANTLVCSLLGMLSFKGCLILMNVSNSFWMGVMVQITHFFAEVPGSTFDVNFWNSSQNKVEVIAVKPNQLMVDVQMNGKHYWVDCGGGRGSMLVLDQYIKARGITEVEELIISHLDGDHCGNAVELMYRWPKMKLRINECEREHVLVQTWVKKIDRFEERVVWVGKENQRIKFEDGGEIWLGVNERQKYMSRANDRGMVVGIKMDEMIWMIIMDGGFETEQWLKNDQDFLKCNVLIYNQGEEDHGLSLNFLSKIMPKWIIFERVLAREQVIEYQFAVDEYIKNNAVPAIEVSQKGAIKMELNGGEWQLEEYQSGDQHQLR